MTPPRSSYGGAASAGEPLLHAELLRVFCRHAGVFSRPQRRRVGLGRRRLHGRPSRLLAAWRGCAGGPYMCLDPSRSSCLSVPCASASSPGCDPSSFEAQEAVLRRAMLDADASAPHVEGTKRGRGAAGRGRSAGPEWVERALRASSVAIVLGGGAMAGGGTAGDMVLSSDAYWLELVPADVIPCVCARRSWLPLRPPRSSPLRFRLLPLLVSIRALRVESAAVLRGLLPRPWVRRLLLLWSEAGRVVAFSVLRPQPLQWRQQQQLLLLLLLLFQPPVLDYTWQRRHTPRLQLCWTQTWPKCCPTLCPCLGSSNSSSIS